MQPLGGDTSSNSLTAQARIHLSNDPAKRTNILLLVRGSRGGLVFIDPQRHKVRATFHVLIVVFFANVLVVLATLGIE
jgi:hypothetical protein